MVVSNHIGWDHTAGRDLAEWAGIIRQLEAPDEVRTDSIKISSVKSPPQIIGNRNSIHFTPLHFTSEILSRSFSIIIQAGQEGEN